MNVPNRLTILRVIMIPVFILFMLWQTFPYSDYIAAGVFILACVTDFFDGYIARKYNQVTTFGKFMDPLADKILVCSALICFLAEADSPMPVWVVIVIIGREFIISGFRLVASDNGVVIAANYWGKFKTTFQMLMIIVLVLDISHPVFELLGVVLTYIALLLTIISLVDYVWKNKDVLKEQK